MSFTTKLTRSRLTGLTDVPSSGCEVTRKEFEPVLTFYKTFGQLQGQSYVLYYLSITLSGFVRPLLQLFSLHFSFHDVSIDYLVPFRTVPSLLQRLAGKSIPIEKFVMRKSRKFYDQQGNLFLPAQVVFSVAIHCTKEKTMWCSSE